MVSASGRRRRRDRPRRPGAGRPAYGARRGRRPLGAPRRQGRAGRDRRRGAGPGGREELGCGSRVDTAGSTARRRSATRYVLRVARRHAGRRRARARPSTTRSAGWPPTSSTTSTGSTPTARSSPSCRRSVLGSDAVTDRTRPAPAARPRPPRRRDDRPRARRWRSTSPRARGVTLVTCTAGEMGEILVPELEHLAADQDDRLGEHRRGELDDAMKELGVTDHRFLGGFGTYRDSGMQWHEDGHAVAADDVHDNAFWNADLTEAADHLVAGDPRGPARRCWSPTTSSAATATPTTSRPTGSRCTPPQLAAVPSYRRDLGEPGTSPRSTGARCRRAGCARACGALREAGDTTTFEGMDPDGPLPPFVTPDERPRARASTARTTSSRRWPRCGRTRTQIDRRRAVLRAVQQRRQPSVGRRSSTGSPRAPPGPARRRRLETDLFAGL